MRNKVQERVFGRVVCPYCGHHNKAAEGDKREGHKSMSCGDCYRWFVSATRYVNEEV